MFKLRFPKSEVRKWASRYVYPGEDHLIQKLLPPARQRGYLKKEEFLAVCRWKTPRSQPRAATNEPDYLKSVTDIALKEETPDRLKIEILTLLSGVGWPTASVILHLCDHKPYPILDFRALWSLRCKVPSEYGYALWREYTEYTRALSTELGCDMRTLDRALWQYSKERQGKSDRR